MSYRPLCTHGQFMQRCIVLRGISALNVTDSCLKLLIAPTINFRKNTDRKFTFMYEQSKYVWTLRPSGLLKTLVWHRYTGGDKAIIEPHRSKYYG